jgi:hypothetical protein
MDLTMLSHEQLQSEFLRINKSYLIFSEGWPSNFSHNKEFQNIRTELHAVLDELNRRRELRKA